jgi:hypothetical protein
MTANASLVTVEQDNILLVPNRAIVADRQANKYYVYRVQGDQAIKVEVTVGLRDASHTEIIDGLQEGDKLAIDYNVDRGLPFGPGHD